MTLTGRTALITGGGTGIGAAISVALAREGCRVMIAGRRETKLREVAASATDGAEILSQVADVAKRDQVEGLVATALELLGQIDILVLSAGVNVVERKMDELSYEDWDKLLDINLTGAFNCIKAVLPHMRARASGLIVSISSIAGKRAFPPSGAAYCASKFGLHGLTHMVGVEEWKHGVRTCIIYPGEVNTEIMLKRPEPVPEERKQRMLQGEDVGAAVVFAASLPPRACVPELVIVPSYQIWT